MPAAIKDEELSQGKQLIPMSPRGRKESEPLKISRRSNSLALEPRYWASRSQLPATTKTAILYTAAEACSREEPEEYDSTSISKSRPALAKTYSYTTPINGQQARKSYTTLTPYYTYGPNATTRHRQVVRSVLPLDNSAMYNNYKNRGSMLDVEHKNRLRRSKSTGSQITNNEPITPREPRAKITDMPTEILNQIMGYLSQKDVGELMLVTKSLVEIAADHMYYHPKFATTYRFAQFAHTVSHEKHYALRVRHLDVSYFTEVPHLQRTPMAGWREWKFRSHDLYRPPQKLSVPPKKPRKRATLTSRRGHPAPNPFLHSWALSRDIPLGGLCHCLQACLNLRVVNLSRCHLADDHLVEDVDYPADAWTGLIYVSDLPKSWTWKSDELRPVYNMYVVEQLVKLKQLETIIATNWVGLSTGMVRGLLNRGQPSLEMVDFVGSGLEREKPWATKGSRREVQRIVAEMDEADPTMRIVSLKSLP